MVYLFVLYEFWLFYGLTLIWVCCWSCFVYFVAWFVCLVFLLVWTVICFEDIWFGLSCVFCLLIWLWVCVWFVVLVGCLAFVTGCDAAYASVVYVHGFVCFGFDIYIVLVFVSFVGLVLLWCCLFSCCFCCFVSWCILLLSLWLLFADEVACVD